MAEAFAIIGLAAAIAQFVGIGINIVSGSKEAYDSSRSMRQETAELKLIVEDIHNLSQEVLHQKTSSPQSTDVAGIRGLATECDLLAVKLRQLLETLVIREDARFRRLESGRVAVQGFLKRGQIQDLLKRLEELDRRLRFRVSRLLQESRHSAIISEIQSLGQKHENEGIRYNSQLSQLQAEILEVTGIMAEDVANQVAGLNRLSSKLYALIDEHRRVDKQLKIVESLVFTELKWRQDRIPSAQHATLLWLYDKSLTTFCDWLELGHGIYWINGLAGSGKSTLMKYASNHYSTRQALTKWAGGDKLIMASYFFWNQGNMMQRSQLGLLQTLLYHILKAAPELITAVCPDHYGTEPWDLKEITQAFQQLSQQTVLNARFCFFIDGLDEFNGEEEEILQALSFLTSSPHVKICASSRPWPQFRETFTDEKRMLIVQELTLDDMKQYVKSKLVENQNFAKIEEKDPRCQNIITKIAKRAQGVWLWVFLVVNDIKKAIKGEEEYEKLEMILEELPEDLDEYFKTIMKRIKPYDREEAAQIFLITVEAVRPLPVLAFTFLSSEKKNPNYAIDAEINALTDSDIHEMYKKWRNRIHYHCGDLLVVDEDQNGHSFFRYRVDFLHRTVRDFLRENYKYVLKEDVTFTFNAKVSLSKMILALLKAFPNDQKFRRVINEIIGLTDELLYYAQELEKQENNDQTELLDELDRVNKYHTRGERNHWTNARDPPSNGSFDVYAEGGRCNFLALTVQARLVHYVKAKLDSNPRLIDKVGRPLLDYALRPKRRTPIDLPYHVQREDVAIDEDLVELLLERQANPNEPVFLNEGQTVWGLFILSCYENAESAPKNLKAAWMKAALSLIRKNADPSLIFKIPVEGRTSNDRKVRKTARFKQEVPVEGYPQPKLHTDMSVSDMFSVIFGPHKAAQLSAAMNEVAQRRKAQSGWVHWAKNILW